jgi:hypothetical protein
MSLKGKRKQNINKYFHQQISKKENEWVSVKQ